MRTENALKNIIVTFLSSAIMLLLALLVRRTLLLGFDLELVAYDGLLNNIFSLLAIAEMGSCNLFNYRMYKAFADQDQNRINFLISMYRTLYRIIGSAIALICLLLFFLLPVIFREKVQLWGYFRIMFIMYAITSVSSYFFGYWATLLIAGQKEYKIAATQTVAKIFLQTAKVIVLWTSKSYLLFLFFSCSADVAVNFFVAHCARREYSMVQIVSVCREDYRREGVFRELREILVSKIAGTLTYSTDNLLIMFLFNAGSVAMYNNYILIGSNCTLLFTRLIYPIRASLADAVHKESKEACYQLYRAIDLFDFFLSSIIFVCFAVVFQPAITLIFGEAFLLPMEFVLAYSLQNYVTMRYQTTLQLRGCFGEYWIERKYIVLGMIINFVASILLSRVLGLMGIVLGTVLAGVCLWQAYLIIVDRQFFHKRLLRIWGRELLFALLAGAELIGVRFLTSTIPYTFVGMLLCGILGITVTTAINIVIFCRTSAFQSILAHLIPVLKRRFFQ